MINKKRFVAISIVLLLSFALLYFAYWAFGHSRISIVTENSAQETSVTIRSKDYSKNYSFSGSASSVIVPKGEYTVVILSANRNYIEAVNAKSLLRESKIETKLNVEKNRVFIGDNPRECSNIVDTLLVSYPCGGSLIDMGVHVPATDTTPTYFKSIRSSLSGSGETVLDIGNIEGVVKNNGKTYVMVHQPEIEGYSVKEHVLYEVVIDQGNVATNYVKSMDFLRPSGSYTINSDSDGNLVIFSNSLSEAFVGKSFFDNFASAQLTTDKPEGYSPLSLSYNGSEILEVYSKAPKNFSQLDTDKLNSMVFINGENNIKKKIDNVYVKFISCGKYYCALNAGGELEIFNGKLNREFVIYSVKDFVYTDGSIRAIVPEGVAEMNLESRSGNISYSFGNYKFKSLSSVDGQVIVAVSAGSKDYALLLDNSDVGFEIDKKILELEDSFSVKLVSVYKNNVFISPELGELQLSEDGMGLDYDPKIKAEASQTIQSLIKTLDIENNGYKVKVNNL